MGKGEEEPLPITITDLQSTTARNADHCCCSDRIASIFRFRCVFILVLGVSVLLSALFWLPPFFRHGDQGDLDLDSHFKGHDIVASFMVEKPLFLLKGNLSQLQDDIFDEIRVPTTKVVIISAESIDVSNTTRVIFGVDPNEKYSKILPAAKSLIRASFVSLVLRQPSLRLTESLFGEPSSFEVLKFTGGITITPPQSAFPLQKVQILFNFTLNFSIEQIQDDFDELRNQLKSGLHLAPYENLHVSLTNSRGSTVAAPTTVQTSVVLAVGSSPSMGRLKQLAQTIKGSSPTKNLGLNNTIFGKVKQISLSSILQHSLNGTTPAPSPAPLPHHHHHHHHHHLPPAKPPSPASMERNLSPVPSPNVAHHGAAKPPDCRSRKRKHPLVAPPPLQSVPHPASSPLPNVVFSRTHHPPSNVEPPDITPSVSFYQPTSSCAGVLNLSTLSSFLALLALHLLHQK